LKTVNLREVPLSEIVDLPVNRWAACFPMLEKNASKRDEGKTNTVTLSELADSIVKNGLQEPIVLIGEEILDGRNRRESCIMAAKALGVSHDEFMVTVEDFEGSEEEAKSFVKALNLDRRDLDPTKRATSALKWWDAEAAEAKKRLTLGAEMTNAQRWGTESPSPNLGGAIGKTSEVLAAEFRVSKGYIEDARRLQREKEDADKLAEAHRIAAEKKEQEEIEAREAHRLALEAGDKNKAVEANLKANQAQMAVVEEREKAAARAQEAASKASTLEALHNGKKKLSEVRKERQQEGKDERELAIERASAKFNKAFTDLLDSGRFLLEEGRPNDQENVRRKFVRICDEFGDLEPFEGIESSEDTAAYWADVEADNTDFGIRHGESGTASVAHSKPCGCDFSGTQSCPICE